MASFGNIYVNEQFPNPHSHPASFNPRSKNPGSTPDLEGRGGNSLYKV